MISSLQENILRLAFKKNFVTCEELLVELWGRGAQEHGTTDKAQYASRHASLSRVLTKLWMKNLIVIWKNLTRYRTAITLTPEGETLARAILAEGQKK
jgi:hypothetical protein